MANRTYQEKLRDAATKMRSQYYQEETKESQASAYKKLKIITDELTKENLRKVQGEKYIKPVSHCRDIV